MTEEENLREALTFYRDAWSMKPNKRYGGLEWSPKATLMDDCGNVARDALASSATAEVPDDVSNLVIAARIVAFENQSPEALKALDIASEAFASRVPWENEPPRISGEQP